MRLSLAYEMQRPVVDDHAVVEETARIHEAAGVDELQFLMATETVPHDKVISSIELFGKHVIPELRKSPVGSSPRKDGTECAHG
jgi:hypothetical protein